MKCLPIKQKFTIFASSTHDVIEKTKCMELQEGLEFYRRCLEYAKLSLQELMKDKTIPIERRQALIDKLLDSMIKIQRNIDSIEELLR